MYATLAAAIGCALLGSVADYYFHVGGPGTMWASFGLVIAIAWMSNTRSAMDMVTSSSTAADSVASTPAYTVSGGSWRRGTQRSTWVKGVPNALILLYVLAFCHGTLMQPGLTLAMQVQPLIVPAALFLTAVLFLALAVSSFFVPKRVHMALIALGSTTLPLVWTLGMMGGSGVDYHHVWLMVGLCSFSAWLMADTQRLVANAERGEMDYVFDAMMVFLHVLPMFARIVSLLTNSVQQHRARQDNERAQQQAMAGGFRSGSLAGVANTLAGGGLSGLGGVAQHFGL